MLDLLSLISRLIAKDYWCQGFKSKLDLIYGPRTANYPIILTLLVAKLCLPLLEK